MAGSPDRTQCLGRYEVTAAGGERVRAFIPPPLPPAPAIDLGPLLGLLDRANQALGRLRRRGVVAHLEQAGTVRETTGR